MSKTYAVGKLAELAEKIRYYRHKTGARPEDFIEFEYRKGDHIGVLSQLRFERNLAGKLTKKTVECIDAGAERRYDGKYDFEITAFLDGHGNRIREL